MQNKSKFVKLKTKFERKIGSSKKSRLVYKTFKTN